VRGDRVFIDTSVWITYFKDRDNQFCEKVDEILTYFPVYVPTVVIAELFQGAKSEKEIQVIEKFIEAFHVIDQTKDTWLKAGRLSFALKKKGITINLIDSYIAVLASVNNSKLFSLDEHFKSIKRFFDLQLIS
jgi:hypothetical protein